jgi:hypothetical protein
MKPVREILKNNQEEIEVEPDLFDGILPEHTNIRGKQYFQEKIKEIINE